MSAIGYKEWRPLLSGKTIEQAKIEAAIIKSTEQYTKRQKTWFKRNKSIQWIENPSKAVEIATTFLYKN